jgi:tRNA modification GTPase
MRAQLSRPGGERLREGFVIVLAGSPNAGKSTLLNTLARRDVAIVSPVAGTTRDAIEVRCDLNGLPVTVVDTAGLRESEDPVEKEGVARARARAADADLVLWLLPPGEAPGIGPSDARVLRVGTKADLARRSDTDVVISAVSGEGISDLLDRVAGIAESALGKGDALLTRERHRQALADAVASLSRALENLDGGLPTELAAEDVRLAVRAVGRITGRVDVEEVLDRLFSTFCIGK